MNYYTANICMGNTTKSCIFKNIFTLVLVQKLQSVIYKKHFQKYKWKYHLSAVLGTVTKCPKGTGSAWEILHREKLCFLRSIYLQCRYFN